MGEMDSCLRGCWWNDRRHHSLRGRFIGGAVTGYYTGDGSDSQMITGMGVDNRRLLDGLIKGTDDGRRVDVSPAEALDGFIVHGDANVYGRVYSFVLFYSD